MKMDWKLELAKIDFGLLDRSVLPDIATKALEEDLDSPSLRILAGLDHHDVWDIEKYWERSLQEFHVEHPTKPESAWLLIRHYIESIVKGNIDPHQGINMIIADVYWNMDWLPKNETYAGDSIGIERLYALWDEAQDISMEDYVPWDKTKTKEELLDEIRNAIKEEAERYKENYLTQRAVALDRQ